jgi:hypothetical protein
MQKEQYFDVSKKILQKNPNSIKQIQHPKIQESKSITFLNNNNNFKSLINKDPITLLKDSSNINSIR